MTTTATQLDFTPTFRDHTQLPESDGTFVFAERAVGKNFQEHPQSLILTDSIGPVLQQLHPDGQYAIGQDCGIYWRETEPPEKGAEAPDWFYVPGVPPKLNGKIRRSYVLSREVTIPMVALEFASGDGEEERDTTPLSVSAQGETIKPGNFWVYEQIIKIPYYGIYEVKNRKLEFYHLQGTYYEKLQPNERGHYLINPLGVEIGLWQGSYLNQNQLWLRWWDIQGNLLLIGDERALLEQQRAEQERQRAQQQQQRAQQQQQQAQQQQQRAEQAEQKAARLAEKLRAMGIDPDAEEIG
ncbi:MAG: Uma2 family endonuclease [Symploca sp. SIO2E6]|nr:Uma2 family endonuclease [Symploca sp. SIO2E6]